MKVKQLSIFLDKTSRSLVDCINILSENDIEITAISYTDSSGLGILHFIVNDPDKACKIFQRNGFGVGETEVMLVDLPDETKSLTNFLNTIKIKGNVNVEYMYMGKDCQFVFRLDDIEAALKVVYTTEPS